MRKILLLLFALLMLACNRTKHNSASDHAYSMLERVAELNAGGDKQGALALADSALRMHPADTTRCWLLSEKAVTLVDMGRMADAVDVAQGAYRLAEKLHDVDAMLNLRGTMGIAYRRLGKTDSALVQYKEGIQMALAEHNAEYEIYLNNCVTVLYSESNRFAEALHYAEKTEKAALAANDTIQRLSARANIGGIYLRQNRHRMALEAMLPCWQEVKSVGYNVLTLKFLSIILKSYSVLGDYQSVAQYMQYADRVMDGMAASSNGVLAFLRSRPIFLASSIDTPSSWHLWTASSPAAHITRQWLRMKALCLENMNRNAEALAFMNRAYAVLDSVKQSDIEKSMSEFTVKYKTLETETALAESKRETAEKANQVLWLVVAVVLLLGVVGIMLYRRRIATQRALLHEKQSYIDGLESERERIAKELHDGVCNDILATKLMLATDSIHAEQYLDDVWRNVRQLSHELMPPSFATVTLDAVVRSYVAAINKNGSRDISLKIDTAFDWSSLPQQVAYEIYRIIQESTANAMKYGDHSTIDISLTANDGNLCVCVANGIGARSADGRHTSDHGIGQQTLQKRADRIGAKLTVSEADMRHRLTLTYRLATI